MVRKELRKISILVAAGNVTTEHKEKAEVLNAFFTSAFNRQISYPQGTLLPDLEVWADMRNILPGIQLETVRELLLHLNCCKSMGPDRIHPRVLRGSTRYGLVACGSNGNGRTVGLDDLIGPFQPCDSMIL